MFNVQSYQKPKGVKENTHIKRQLAVRDMPIKSRMSYILKSKLLEYVNDFDQQRASSERERIAEMDGLENMNMDYLAGAIYMYKYITERTSDVANLDVKPYFDPNREPMKVILNKLSNSNTKVKSIGTEDKMEDIFIYYKRYHSFIQEYNVEGNTQYNVNEEHDKQIPDYDEDDDDDIDKIPLLAQDEIYRQTGGNFDDDYEDDNFDDDYDDDYEDYDEDFW